MPATLLSTAVKLGSTDHHVFTYQDPGGWPDGYLTIMMFTEGSDGPSFIEYQRYALTPGHTPISVPPPPALRGTLPYLLVGVVTSVHRPDVPQTAEEFIDWLDTSPFPFHFSGLIAEKAHFKAARKAAEAWNNEFIVDEDKRRNIPVGIASQRMAELMLRELPSNRLSLESITTLAEFVLARDNYRVKRDAGDLKPCAACLITGTAILNSLGFGIIFAILLGRPAIVDGQEQPRHYAALLEWMLTRIRANYAQASFAEIGLQVIGAWTIVENAMRGGWFATSSLAKMICETFADC